MADLDWWQALVLGIVQGATEWLPVSSSGHLAITHAAVRVAPDTWYDLLLHVATLVVVVAFYRRRLIGLAAAVMRPGPETAAERRLAWALVLASVPIALAGFMLADVVVIAFEHLWVVGVCLLLTAVMLWSTRWAPAGDHVVDARKALWIGVWQAFALFPGVSRSGATLAAALHAGVEREKAVDFAFLLAIPALVGAALFRFLDDPQPHMTGPMMFGMLVSLVVGWVSLAWLRSFVAKHGLDGFAAYCGAAAILAFALA